MVKIPEMDFSLLSVLDEWFKAKCNEIVLRGVKERVNVMYQDRDDHHNGPMGPKPNFGELDQEMLDFFNGYIIKRDEALKRLDDLFESIRFFNS